MGHRRSPLRTRRRPRRPSRSPLPEPPVAQPGCRVQTGATGHRRRVRFHRATHARHQRPRPCPRLHLGARARDLQATSRDRLHRQHRPRTDGLDRGRHSRPGRPPGTPHRPPVPAARRQNRRHPPDRCRRPPLRRPDQRLTRDRLAPPLRTAHLHTPARPARDRRKRPRLPRRFGLVFGAFDFGLDRDGRWHWYECNPNGQWAWFPDRITTPITRAIADQLQHGGAPA